MMGKIKRITIWTLASILLIVVIFWFTRGTALYRPDGSITSSEINQATTLLNNSINDARYTYVDYLSDHQQAVDYGLSSIVVSLKNEDALIDSDNGQYAILMTKDKTASYEIDILEAGFYHIGASYKVSDATLNNITVDL